MPWDFTNKNGDLMGSFNDLMGFNQQTWWYHANMSRNLHGISMEC
jgi:hypothetical protein